MATDNEEAKAATPDDEAKSVMPAPTPTDDPYLKALEEEGIAVKTSPEALSKMRAQLEAMSASERKALYEGEYPAPSEEPEDRKNYPAVNREIEHQRAELRNRQARILSTGFRNEVMDKLAETKGENPDANTMVMIRYVPYAPVDGDEALEAAREVMEMLASVQHDIWAHWMKWMREAKSRAGNNFLQQSLEDWVRWSRQLETPYAELSEGEKESDRQVVRDFVLANPRLNRLLVGDSMLRDLIKHTEQSVGGPVPAPAPNTPADGAGKETKVNMFPTLVDHPTQNTPATMGGRITLKPDSVLKVNANMVQPPSIGRMVHFSSHYRRHDPAIITRVNDDGSVNLVCFPDDGEIYRPKNVLMGEPNEWDFWHWPEFVPAVPAEELPERDNSENDE